MILQFLGRQKYGAQREFLGAYAVTLRLLSLSSRTSARATLGVRRPVRPAGAGTWC